MNPMSGGIRELFNTSVRLLNQPIVKEGVKNVVGSMTFVFGLFEVYDVYQIARGREISTETCSTSPKWVQVANKVVIVCAKVALILSAGVSRPGVFIISSIVGRVFSTTQLERIFGPNTIFAINPRHPRHVISIAAVILSLPCVIQSTCKGINWVYKTMRPNQNTPIDKSPVNYWLTDHKLRLMTLFNAMTSRPTLHVGNQLGRFFLRIV